MTLFVDARAHNLVVTSRTLYPLSHGCSHLNMYTWNKYSTEAFDKNGVFVLISLRLFIGVLFPHVYEIFNGCKYG
jgi:hypothetical protein